MGRRAWTAALVTALAVSSIAAPAFAAPIEGVVVKVDDAEIVIDLGLARGVPVGASLALFRRMVVKHPITGETIEDRFPIGTVIPAQVGSLLTIVRETDGLERAPVLGDFAVYQPPAAPRAPVAKAPKATRSSPGEKVPARATDDVALEATFAQSLGQPLPRRIELFQAYVQAFPKSRHVDAVGRELVTLRALLTQARAPQPAAESKPEPDPDTLTVRHQPPRPIFAGERFEVAIAVIETDRVDSARLLVARDPDRIWVTQPMARDGDYYYRAEVPADLVDRAGEVRYVVEIVRPDGRLTSIVGSYTSPEQLTVQPVPPGSGPPGSTRLDVRGRYVDFNTGGKMADAYFQFDTTLSYTLDWYALKTVRVGVGVIDGEGGRLPENGEEAGETRTISLNYAFAETELALGDWVGLAGRFIGGNRQSDDDDPRSAMTGLEARLRVGRILETRFVAGVSVLDVLGTQGFLNAHIEVFEKVPVRLGVVVTNLPVDENRGLQIEGQAGWRATDWLTLNAEIGWNARNINHYGFTGGGGLSLEW